jgi:hypothetical protein
MNTIHTFLIIITIVALLLVFDWIMYLRRHSREKFPGHTNPPPVPPKQKYNGYQPIDKIDNLNPPKFEEITIKDNLYPNRDGCYHIEWVDANTVHLTKL